MGRGRAVIGIDGHRLVAGLVVAVRLVGGVRGRLPLRERRGVELHGGQPVGRVVDVVDHVAVGLLRLRHVAVLVVAHPRHQRRRPRPHRAAHRVRDHPIHGVVLARLPLRHGPAGVARCDRDGVAHRVVAVRRGPRERVARQEQPTSPGVGVTANVATSSVMLVMFGHYPTVQFGL